MNALHLGTIHGTTKAFRLPLSTVTSTIAILARKGRGKTYTAAVLAEELLEANQIPVIIDPTGAHWGLKSSADGKDAGYKVVVFGGEHADLPLEETAGETIARAIVEQRFPAILDLSLFRKGALRRFLTDFLETLYRLNRQPIHLLADEADEYAPQKTFGDEARVLGAMEDIVRRGRIRGIGCTLITQRPAVLNKNVLTQADMLVSLGMNHPRDIDAIEEWVAVHGDLATAKKMIESLPSLPVGVGWFWAPALDNLFEQVKVRSRRTFDSSATPKPGERVAAPKALAEIDVEALGKEIASTVQRAKENDPKLLKVEIAALRKQLAAKPAAAPQVKEVPVLVFPPEDRRAILDLAGQCADIAKAVGELSHRVFRTVDKIVERPATPTRPVAALPAPRPAVVRLPTGAPADGDSDLGRGGLRRILIALAQRPGLTRQQIGLRAGLSSQSGSFSTYLSKGRANNWLLDQGGKFEITESGLQALGAYDPLPVGDELRAYWLRDLGQGGAARILSTLCEAYPDALTREAIGDKTGLSAASGSFSTYLSKLRGLELIDGRAELRASAELFN